MVVENVSIHIEFIGTEVNSNLNIMSTSCDIEMIKSAIQSFLFDKTKFTKTRARKWLQTYSYTPIKPVDTTVNLHRYRIREPRANATYRTIRVANGVQAVLMWT